MTDLAFKTSIAAMSLLDELCTKIPKNLKGEI